MKISIWHESQLQERRGPAVRARLDAPIESVAVTLSGDGYAAQGCLRKADFEAVKTFCQNHWLRYGEN